MEDAVVNGWAGHSPPDLVPGPRGGTTPRQPVAATDPLFYATLYLRAYAPGEVTPRTYGTGILIRPDLVLTAAHVVFDSSPYVFGPSRSGYAGLVNVWASWLSLPAASASTPRIGAALGWVQSADPNFDLALIKLNAEVPAPGRPLAPAPLADNDLLQFPVRAYGFPLGDPHLYGGQGTCVGVAGQRMFYDADVAEGESGGPVISLQPTGPFLVGVHRAGPGETPAAYGQTNGGVRLTPEAVTWMGDLDAQL